MKSKTLLFVLLLPVVLSSCSSMIKLVGNYPSPNQYGETKLSYDDAWSKVIDYFAVCGIPITTIDKSSGLIVASKMSFVNVYTREDNRGNLIDSSAYVVIPTVRGGFGNILEPNALISGRWEMVGDWNLRLKNEGDKTSINVNLLNLNCFYGNSGFMSTKIPIKSTGVFEKKMIEYLKIK